MTLYMSKKPTQQVVNWWSAPQAALRCDLSVGMVRYLAREEILVPSYGPKGRPLRGQRLRYSYSDLVILRAVARMLEQGVEVKRLKRDLSIVHERYRREGRRKPDLKYLVSDGRRALLLEPGEALERLDNGQRAFHFILNVESLKEDVGPDERGVSRPGRTTIAQLKSNRRKGIPKAPAPQGRMTN